MHACVNRIIMRRTMLSGDTSRMAHHHAKQMATYILKVTIASRMAQFAQFRADVENKVND